MLPPWKNAFEHNSRRYALQYCLSSHDKHFLRCICSGEAEAQRDSTIAEARAEEHQAARRAAESPPTPLEERRPAERKAGRCRKARPHDARVAPRSLGDGAGRGRSSRPKARGCKARLRRVNEAQCRREGLNRRAGTVQHRGVLAFAYLSSPGHLSEGGRGNGCMNPTLLRVTGVGGRTRRRRVRLAPITPPLPLPARTPSQARADITESAWLTRDRALEGPLV